MKRQKCYVIFYCYDEAENLLLFILNTKNQSIIREIFKINNEKIRIKIIRSNT